MPGHDTEVGLQKPPFIRGGEVVVDRRLAVQILPSTVRSIQSELLRYISTACLCHVNKSPMDPSGIRLFVLCS